MLAMAAIQVKDVPDDLHEALRRRAAEQGVTLGQYLLELIRRDLRRPRLATWAERHPTIEERTGKVPDVAAALREAREERDAEIDRRADAWADGLGLGPT
jgi:plasmid stability protein